MSPSYAAASHSTAPAFYSPLGASHLAHPSQLPAFSILLNLLPFRRLTPSRPAVATSPAPPSASASAEQLAASSRSRREDVKQLEMRIKTLHSGTYYIDEEDVPPPYSRTAHKGVEEDIVVSEMDVAAGDECEAQRQRAREECLVATDAAQSELLRAMGF